MGRLRRRPYARSMTTIAPDRAAPDGLRPTEAAPPRTRPSHLFASAASVLLSGLLGLTWLWISVSVFFTGLAAIPAVGAGMLLLIPWVLAMRVAASFERRRALAAHGIDVVVPARRVSTRTGLAGLLVTVWLDATSWQFWRSVLHHHAVMVVGVLITTLFWIPLVTVWGMVEVAAQGVPVRFAGGTFGTWGLIGLAAVALLVALGALVLGVLAERGLGRVMLPSGDDALRAEVAELTERRQGAVDAADAERLRIERDLHDGVQPRLVALGMTLGMARPKIATDPERAEQLVGEAHEETKAIITELRQLARGIHPAVLTDRGLDAALSALAARSVVPVDLRVDLPHRAGREEEAVAYFVVSEALTNVAKHARAQHITVDLRRDGPALRIVVIDDGDGGAAVRRDGVSTGLAGLTDRVRATGGRLTVESEPGRGTRLIATIPTPPPSKEDVR